MNSLREYLNEAGKRIFSLAGVFLLFSLSVFGSTTNPNILATFPLAEDDEIFTLPVTIGASNYLFLLDSHATPNILDVSFKPTLGSPIRSVQVNSAADLTIKSEIYPSPQMRVGPLPVSTNLPVGCLDLTTLREPSGCNLTGVLGLPLYRDYAVEADFDSGALKIFKQVSPEQKAAYKKIRMREDRVGFFAVRAEVSRQSIDFFLDTGQAGSELSIIPAHFERLSAAGLLKHIPNAISINASGAVRQRRGLLKQLTLGPFSITNILTTEAPFNFIGFPLLRRFNYIVDAKNSALYLRENKFSHEVQHLNFPGLCYVRRQGALVLDYVEPGTTGAEAGLTKGDKILKIGGFETTGMKMGQVRRLLSTNTAPSLPLIVNRGTETLRLSLKPSVP